MTSKKVFYVMIGLVTVTGLLLATSVILGDGYLHKQSDRLTSLKLDNAVIEAQQTSLAQANKDLLKYSDLEVLAKQIVPQEKNQARVTREILNLAGQAGIKITSVTFPASTLGQVAPKPPVSADGATPAPKPAAPAVTQVKPVDGIKGLYQLDITVVSDTTQPTTYAQLITFLRKLEQNRRTAQVSQIAIQPDSQNRSGLNFTLTITVFIKP